VDVFVERADPVIVGEAVGDLETLALVVVVLVPNIVFEVWDVADAVFDTKEETERRAVVVEVREGIVVRVLVLDLAIVYVGKEKVILLVGKALIL
jgi:hypothetical protein